MKLLKSRKGFTLIELLVVIAIIGILAALIIVSLNGARQKASDTQLKNNARNIDTALAQYSTDHNSNYPDSSAQGEVGTVLNTATMLQPYLSTNSAAFNHATTATSALYRSNAASGSTSYAQAWELKSTTDTIITSGNGVYALSGARGTVTVNTLLFNFAAGQTGIGAGETTASTLAFSTYGPQ